MIVCIRKTFEFGTVSFSNFLNKFVIQSHRSLAQIDTNKDVKHKGSQRYKYHCLNFLCLVNRCSYSKAQILKETFVRVPLKYHCLKFPAEWIHVLTETPKKLRYRYIVLLAGVHSVFTWKVVVYGLYECICTNNEYMNG